MCEDPPAALWPAVPSAPDSTPGTVCLVTLSQLPPAWRRRVSRSEFSFSARSYCSDCAAVRRDGAAEDLYCPGLLLLCLAQRVLALPQLGVGQKPVCTRDMTCAAQCLQALSVFMLMLGQLLRGAPELRQRAERSPSHWLHSTAPRTCSASHVKPEYRQLGRMLSTVRAVAVARRGQSGSAGNQGSALVPRSGSARPAPTAALASSCFCEHTINNASRATASMQQSINELIDRRGLRDLDSHLAASLFPGQYGVLGCLRRAAPRLNKSCTLWAHGCSKSISSVQIMLYLTDRLQNRRAK